MGIQSTRAYKFITERYGVSTPLEAVELAARRMRDPVLKGFEASYPLPVDVRGIARRQKLTLGSDLSASSAREAELLTGESGFVVRLRRRQVKTRSRLSLAHELGHTLFFRDRQHQIGVVSRAEILAEDTICQLFASALLIPAEAFRALAPSVPDGPPWELLGFLERLGRRFGVSLEAIVARLGVIQPPSPPYVLVCSRVSPNRQTGTNPRLRVWASCCLGPAKRLVIWRNRTPRGLGLPEMDALFDAWDQLRTEDEKASRGRHTLDERGELVTACAASVKWRPAHVEATLRDGWRKAIVPSLASHCLYGWRGASKSDVYVLTLLKPSELP